MNTNYLLEDELAYELACRGVKSTGDVQVFRKCFPSIHADDVLTNITNLGGVNMAEMYNLVCVKLGELDNMASQLNSTQPLPVNRIVKRVVHLRNRLKHLCELGSRVVWQTTVRYSPFVFPSR
jgi:hypothetical protein